MPEVERQARRYILNVAQPRRTVLLDASASGAAVAESVADFQHSRNHPLICFVSFADNAITHLAEGRLGQTSRNASQTPQPSQSDDDQNTRVLCGGPRDPPAAVPVSCENTLRPGRSAAVRFVWSFRGCCAESPTGIEPSPGTLQRIAERSDQRYQPKKRARPLPTRRKRLPPR